MILTKDWLQQRIACDASLAWIDSIPPTDIVEAIRGLVSTQPLWVIWIGARIMTQEQCVQFMEYVIDKVKDIFESVNPGDCYSFTKSQLIDVMKSIPDNNNPVSLVAKMLFHYIRMNEYGKLPIVQIATYEMGEMALNLKPEIKTDVANYCVSLVEGYNGV